MENVNFVKNIDNLGRIVIPMDIRRKLQINTGDVLSISCVDKNVILTKYSSLESNYKIIEILKLFIEIFGIKVILMNRDYVIYSNIVSNGSRLGNELRNLVINGIQLKCQNQEYKIGEQKVNGIYNMLPIVTSEGIEGSIIVFGDEGSRSLEICTLLDKIMVLELNIA